MDKIYTVGVDVGGTKIAFGLFGPQKELIAKSRIETPISPSPEVFFDRLLEEVTRLCHENNLTTDTLRGIGIGLPSFIRTDGYLLKTSNIPVLHHFNAKKYLEQALPDILFELDNDTHVAALAEYRQGAGRGFRDIIFCAVSSGIASAPIIEGKLFRGSYGYSGESGHMLLTPGEGILCGCGKRGCVMSYCSGHMIVKHIRSWIEAGDSTLMTSMVASPEQITTHEISRAYIEGDAMAIRAVKQMQHYLALWFYNLYVFMNINCFVLGGGLLKMGDALWDGVLTEFKALNDSDDPVYFKKAELVDDFGILGANELLYQK